ncbi:MAG: NUDIX domain-containing protein [Flavobacteriales bacterium]|nr:NUDIX domain-containing protein [Flavobacteriales bacterium]
MYKIFINDKPLYLVEKFSEYQDYNTSLLVNFHGQEDLGFGIETLENQRHVLSLMVFNADLNKLWDAFRKDYKFIEAAGGLIENADSQHLLIYRNGKWDLPKGKLEPNETTEEAAIREVEEECGIGDLIIRHKLPSTLHTYQQKGVRILKETHWYAMAYAGSETPKPQKEEGIEKAVWLTPQEIEEASSNTYGSIIDVLSTLA